jgi:hypothetical protein
VLLGLAAALAVLVIYDVAYVWPLCRRYAALAKRCRGLESSMAGIAGLASGVADVDRRVAEAERRVAEAERRAAEQWHRIGERLGHLELATEGRAYEQAIGFAEQGGETGRLITCFGLTEGEADLVHLLHGSASRTKSAGAL